MYAFAICTILFDICENVWIARENRNPIDTKFVVNKWKTKHYSPTTTTERTFYMLCYQRTLTECWIERFFCS